MTNLKLQKVITTVNRPIEIGFKSGGPTMGNFDNTMIMVDFGF